MALAPLLWHHPGAVAAGARLQREATSYDVIMQHCGRMTQPALARRLLDEHLGLRHVATMPKRRPPDDDEPPRRRGRPRGEVHGEMDKLLIEHANLVFLGHAPDKKKRSPWGAISYVVDGFWDRHPDAGKLYGASRDAMKRRLLAALSGHNFTVPNWRNRAKPSVYFSPLSLHYRDLEITKALLTPGRGRRGVVCVSGPDTFSLGRMRRKSRKRH